MGYLDVAQDVRLEGIALQSSEVKRLTELEDWHWWYRERRALLDRELRRLPSPHDGERALDIGAAGGGNTRVLTAHGWQALATDMSETGVAAARERGIPVLHADARRLPLPSRSFGLVTALDVLEHIDEDDGVANEIFRVLLPGGSVVVTVPVGMDLWSAHDEAVGHVRRYERQELLSLLEKVGLVVDDVWSWNVLLRPVVALRRRTSKGSDLDAPHPVVNAGLTAVITLERYLPVRQLRGVSLVVRAHRPD